VQGTLGRVSNSPRAGNNCAAYTGGTCTRKAKVYVHVHFFVDLKSTVREKNHKRLLTPGNKQGCWRGRGWRDGVTGGWALRTARDEMSTGCYMQLINY